MIDAKELRLGNWLINEHGREYQVDGHEIYQFDTMPEYRELWHGIPLTPEVLEACGFVSKKRWYYKEKFCLGYLTTDLHFQAEWKFGGVEGTWNLLDIKYLHQLQNLYFDLCGQELEYKPKV